MTPGANLAINLKPCKDIKFCLIFDTHYIVYGLAFRWKIDLHFDVKQVTF